MQPAKLNYKIYQGSTFQEAYRWESQTKVYVPIQNISKSAPCLITTSTIQHNLPVGWRFRVVGAGGMKEINSIGEDSYYIFTQTANLPLNTIEVNQVNSLMYSNYTTGGVVEYRKPTSLLGLKARMQIRRTVSSNDVIYQASSTTGEIVIHSTYQTITLTIPAAVTAGFNFTTAVYSIELYDNSGTVIPFLTGSLTLVPEITR